MPIRVCTQCGAQFRDAAALCPHDGGSLVERPDPLIGRVLGRRYRIVDELGSGGMGTVYRARHVLVGREVALKLLSRSATRDPMWRERFVREAQTTNLLKHENIVDITDFGDEGGAVFLVMELLEGESLEARLERGPLAPLEAIDIALPVVAALNRAHQLDVVHRDIKPGNVFLCATPQGIKVKVLDFGIARVRNDAKLTETGVLLGTPEYMSPEQSIGDPAGPSSDLYSLGVVLFEAIAGRLPFLGSGAHVLVQHAHDTPPRLKELAPDVPEVLDNIVARLLAKSPRERFADGHSLAEALTRARPAASLAPQRVSRTPKATLGFEEADLSTSLIEPFSERFDALESLVKSQLPGEPSRRVDERRRALRLAFDALCAAVRDGEDVASALVQADVAHRTTISRIGGALDVLSRDASALRERIDALRDEQRAAQLDADALSEQLSEHSPTPALGLDPFTSLTLPDALAALDHRVRTAQARSVNLARELQALEREAEDVNFQIEALRGRMGAVQGEIVAQRAERAPREGDLSLRLAAAQDAFVAAAEALREAVDAERRGG